MQTVPLTDFGKDVKIGLVKLGKTQEWLMDEVRKRTGQYVDNSVMRKINTGQSKRPAIENAIREILEIGESEGGAIQ